MNYGRHWSKRIFSHQPGKRTQFLYPQITLFKTVCDVFCYSRIILGMIYEKYVVGTFTFCLYVCSSEYKQRNQFYNWKLYTFFVYSWLIFQTPHYIL